MVTFIFFFGRSVTVPLVPSSGSGSLMFWDYNDPGGQAETLIGKKKVRLLIIKWLLYIFYKTHTPSP